MLLARPCLSRELAARFMFVKVCLRCRQGAYRTIEAESKERDPVRVSLDDRSSPMLAKHGRGIQQTKEIAVRQTVQVYS